MSLKEALMNDLKQAMKDKDTIRKNAIQMARSAILQFEKDSRKELSEDEVLDVIMKQVKQRKDSLEEFVASGREELIANLNREIEVLMAYLPQQLTDDELFEIVKETVTSLGITTMKEMGKLMGAVIPKIKGRAENRRVNEIAKKLLQ